MPVSSHLPSDDGGSFFSDCGPFPVPSSLPFFYLSSHPFFPPLDCLHFPLSFPPLFPFFPLPSSSLYPSSFLSSPRPASSSAPFLLPLISLFPSTHFPSLPPLRSRLLKSSYEVWRSAVSSLSGVWCRAPAEVQFGAF